jgi:tRNA pseudouridine38-40 synthase
MRNFKLLIEYDGTHYGGWQRQENARTIQGEIERVLAIILQEQVSITGAGRTDSGVHARGQVANFTSECSLNPFEMKGGLNGLLPEDIVVHDIEEAALDFHARYSARERHYTYLITRTPTALLRYCAWHVKYDLHVDLMNEAAGSILGIHDFESFCKANSDVEHFRCNVLHASWKEEGSLLTFSIGADRFLHGMVRALVGTMVDVGRNYITLQDFQNIFQKKDRSEAGMAAPAKGLVLERVVY